MADVVLHSLLFPPDATANSYIISDIALELVKHGHKVTVITTTPHYSVLQENLEKQPFTDGDKKWYKKSNYNGIECYHIIVPSEKGSIKKRFFTFLRFHWYALKLSKQEIRADIVIAQSPPLSIGIINGSVGKRKKAKTVYIVQDLFPDGPITQGKIKNKLLIKILRSIEKRVYKRNDAIIAISDEIREHLKSRVPGNKILRTIPNFADTDIYHPMSKDNILAEKYGLKDKFVVSYVGNIGNAHDLTPVLECAKALKSLGMEFIIAGNGIKEDYYKGMARDAGLQNVKFIGYQKREDTPMINALSDICLVMLAPHIKGFSFPSKIYTLMAMAKPIIVMCSAESNAADFITETKSGWAVGCGQCQDFIALIRELYYNRDMLNQFGSNSLKIVESGYTKEYVGDQYDKLVKELCD